MFSKIIKRNFSNLNKFSKNLTQPKERGAAQAMLYSLGWNDKDFKKPQVAIGSMWYEGNPCNSKLDILSKNVANSLPKSEILPIRFNTIGVSDGISMGTDGMKYSLPSRELISDSIETMMGAHYYDGIICIPGCDKNLPGSLMGMLRVNRPGLIIYGGSMKSTLYNDKNLDIVSAFESYGEYIKGKITEEERSNIIKNSCDSGACGSCSGFYTANTMSVCLEVMGMTLPNSSSNPSLSFSKLKETYNIDKVMKNLLEKDIKPRDIITRQSLLNAIRMVSIIGGSTNAVIHLLAIAKCAEVELTLQDFIDNQDVPILANCKPHGKYVMNDIANIVGGTSKIIKYCIEKRILNGNCLTVTGNTLLENVQDYEDLDFDKQDVIKPIEMAFADKSHIKILKGNLAPNGCVAKINSTKDKFKGYAKVFENEKDMLEALQNDKIKNNHFIIIRNQGETVGCPEMLAPTSALVGYFGSGNTPPLATDGRFSGGSRGILIAHLPDAYKEDNKTFLIQDGDKIEIDIENNEININVLEETFDSRSLVTYKKELPKMTGHLKKFAKLSGNLENGYLCE